MDLVYFTTPVPDTSDTSATRAIEVRYKCDTSDTSATRVRHEQQKSNTSATQSATRVRHKCDKSATQVTQVRHERGTQKKFDFVNGRLYIPVFLS